ncbi:DUF5366 family protein [Bacillus sp. 1P06AnD]|uniref:DUF5366 family protein n=1 Tax=Bacillus sp. 1P06AnD TaxID=3132208 RepID=UPI0039A2D6E6
MKNTYFTGYFPFISIVLFSLSYAVFAQKKVLELFISFGVYDGLLSFFSASGIRLTVLLLLAFGFFMVLAAMKLISDTSLHLALLLFSKDQEGNVIRSTRFGAVIYLIGGVGSLFCSFSVLAVSLLFFITTMTAFIYFIYQASAYLSTSGLFGLVLFLVLIWSSLVVLLGYSILKLYNGLASSIPI